MQAVFHSYNKEHKFLPCYWQLWYKHCRLDEKTLLPMYKWQCSCFLVAFCWKQMTSDKGHQCIQILYLLGSLCFSKHRKNALFWCEPLKLYFEGISYKKKQRNGFLFKMHTTADCSEDCTHSEGRMNTQLFILMRKCRWKQMTYMILWIKDIIWCNHFINTHMAPNENRM